jgi:hypothetical protein
MPLEGAAVLNRSRLAQFESARRPRGSKSPGQAERIEGKDPSARFRNLSFVRRPLAWNGRSEDCPGFCLGQRHAAFSLRRVVSGFCDVSSEALACEGLGERELQDVRQRPLSAQFPLHRGLPGATR